jgi:hypothetical protein
VKNGVKFSPPAVSRRVMLRGACGTALALPLLDSLVAPEARAANAPYPKRLVILFTPNGTVPSNFFGSGNTNTFEPGSILQPLVDAGHKDDLIVVDGLDEVAAQAAYGDAHGVGMGCLLTGKKLQTGEMFVAGMGGPGSGWPDNISIDQVVAKAVGTTTQLGSLELAGKRAPGNIWTRMSYSGPAEPIAPQEDPQRAFDRVFANVGDGGMEPDAMARLRARRKSVLDNAIGELDGLMLRVSADDKKKLETHANTLRDMESRLDNMTPTETGCTIPTRPTVSASPEVIKNNSGMETINASNDTTFPEIIGAQLDNIVGALACDVTRVASLLFCPSRSDVVMSWLNYGGQPFREAHHEVSHFGDGEKESQNKLTVMNQWYATQIAGFISKLKAIPEGDGTLFSNTVILWVNELGIGNTHSHTRLPFLIAGSAGGHFRTGRYVTNPGRTPHNNLLVSIANAMGVEPGAGNIFGDPQFCTGPLPGLTA